ncbi:MAG: hypothetical protein JWO20_3147 [Candidatus Angelobacter sp.]|nr:hypothetical protein [Candidatus Angelobacter sp.]
MLTSNKKYFLAALLCAACCGFAQSPQTTTSTIGAGSQVTAPNAAYKFPDGQTLVYGVDWRLFNAGTATLRMERAGREQRIVATADALGFVALLYHVQDRFESFVDPKTYCSLTLSKHTEEGFRRLETNITFDQARRKSVLSEKNLKTSQSKKVENDTPGCVVDVVSSAYYISSLPLVANGVHRFPMNDGGKTVDVKVTVEAREDVKTPAGTFKTVRIVAAAENGPLKNRGQIWIWYTDDAAHTPVQMKARLFWGTLVFHLQKIENSPQR